MYFGDSRSIGSKVLHTVLLSAAFLSSLCQAGPVYASSTVALSSARHTDAPEPPIAAVTSLLKRQEDVESGKTIEVTITTDGRVITTKVVAGKIYTVGEKHGQSSMHTSTVVTREVTSKVISTQYVLPTFTQQVMKTTPNYPAPSGGQTITIIPADTTASLVCGFNKMDSQVGSFLTVMESMWNDILYTRLGWVGTNRHLYLTTRAFVTEFVGSCSNNHMVYSEAVTYLKLITLTARAVEHTEYRTMKTVVTVETVLVTTWESVELTVYEGKTEYITKKAVATKTVPGKVLTKGITQYYTPTEGPESVFVYGSSTYHFTPHTPHIETLPAPAPSIPTLLTTVRTPGPFSYTTTVSTQTTFTVGNDGNTTPKKIYHVDTPTVPTVTMTVTSSGPFSYTTTVSTQNTYVVGTNGMTTPKKIYHVDTPSV